MTTIWLVWAQYSDRSGDPQFIGWTSSEDGAAAIKAMIERTSPGMSIFFNPVPRLPDWGQPNVSQ